METEIKSELGLYQEDDWIVTVIISVASCLFTSFLCCLVNYCIKKKRDKDVDKEMRE